MQLKDGFCKPLISILRDGSEHPKFRDKCLYYILKGNVLYRKVRRDNRDYFLLVVPRGLQQTVLNNAHDAPEAGHLGIQRTYDRVALRYWWPGVLNDVTR